LGKRDLGWHPALGKRVLVELGPPTKQCRQLLPLWSEGVASDYLCRASRPESWLPMGA